MRVTLDVRAGTDAARAVVIEGATPRVIGRGPVADERFPNDRAMSDQHVSLWVEDGVCHLRDLESERGTFVNQRGVTRTTLSDGDYLQVGETVFQIRVASVRTREVPAERQEFSSRAEHALWFLRRGPGALYGVLDAARDELVLPFLYDAGVQHQSLYEGPRGEELALVAPSLLAFPPEAAALVELVAERWGASWGIFLRCDGSFRDVRRHLRRLLRVRLQDGRRVLFRFYDPRVLRAYLPTCSSDEAAQMFGPITQYLAEGRRGETAMRFTRTSDGVNVESEALTSVPDVSTTTP